MSEQVQSAITLLKAAIMVDAVSTKTSRENVDNKITALIAAVEREALERAETKCNGIAKGWFEARDPDDFTRGCAGGAIACREAVRALIESKEG